MAQAQPAARTVGEALQLAFAAERIRKAVFPGKDVFALAVAQRFAEIAVRRNVPALYCTYDPLSPFIRQAEDIF